MHRCNEVVSAVFWGAAFVDVYTTWGRAAIIHNLTPEYNHFEGRKGIENGFQHKHNRNL